MSKKTWEIEPKSHRKNCTGISCGPSTEDIIRSMTRQWVIDNDIGLDEVERLYDGDKNVIQKWKKYLNQPKR